MMNTFILGIGSNCSERELQMNKAMKFIYNSFERVKISSIYETPAENGKDAPYLNAVAIADSELDIEKVTLLIKQWEQDCGRTVASKLEGVIPIDLDVVTWNEDVVRPKDFNKSYFTKGLLQLIKSE